VRNPRVRHGPFETVQRHREQSLSKMHCLLGMAYYRSRQPTHFRHRSSALPCFELLLFGMSTFRSSNRCLLAHPSAPWSLLSQHMHVSVAGGVHARLTSDCTDFDRHYSFHVSLLLSCPSLTQLKHSRPLTHEVEPSLPVQDTLDLSSVDLEVKMNLRMAYRQAEKSSHTDQGMSEDEVCDVTDALATRLIFMMHVPGRTTNAERVHQTSIRVVL